MICECHLTQQAFLNWEEIIFKSFPVWACMYTELEKQWEKYSLKKEWRDLNDGMTQILPSAKLYLYQRYTYRVLQTIQKKVILLCVWAEPAVLGSTKTALKFKYET